MSAWQSPPAQTISASDAGRQLWDVIVVGAGPAGSMAARELARMGAAVLLLDHATFPRQKVCGCCLNGAAMRILREAKIAPFPNEQTQPLTQLRVMAAGRQARIPLTDGIALSREALDSHLIHAAVCAGASFLSGARASLDASTSEGRVVQLHTREGAIRTRSRVLVAADGLAGRLINEEPGFAWRIARVSRIGIGTVVQDGSGRYETGTVTMACGPGGYVGLVRLEDARVNVAAALEPAKVRRCQGPGQAVGALLESAGLPPVTEWNGPRWRGTPGLTRSRSRVAGERLFAIGDAAGYVEPFTGEGIAWALASGQAVAPLAREGARRWSENLAREWALWHRRVLSRRQRGCRLVTLLTRSRGLRSAAMAALSTLPELASVMARRINTPLAMTPSSVEAG